MVEHSRSAAICRRLAPSSRILRIASTCLDLNFRSGPSVFPCQPCPSLWPRYLHD